jgi:hypothetical protein
MGVLLHRLRAGFFWRDADPGRWVRWPGVGAGKRPRWALPRRRTGCWGFGEWPLRRLRGGRGPGPPRLGQRGPGLDRAVEPRGLRIRFSDRGRLAAGGFWGLVGRPWGSLVGWFGAVFGFPVGPVLDRLGDPGDRFQEREEKFLDRILLLLGCSAPEQTPRQPPPESLAEQADQLRDDGERGGRRHGGYVSQCARGVK